MLIKCCKLVFNFLFHTWLNWIKRPTKSLTITIIYYIISNQVFFLVFEIML